MITEFDRGAFDVVYESELEEHFKRGFDLYVVCLVEPTRDPHWKGEWGVFIYNQYTKSRKTLVTVPRSKGKVRARILRSPSALLSMTVEYDFAAFSLPCKEGYAMKVVRDDELPHQLIPSNE